MEEPAQTKVTAVISNSSSSDSSSEDEPETKGILSSSSLIR